MATPLPGFIPREGGPRKRPRVRLAVALALLAAYVGGAALPDGPIQVWLLVLAPFALAAAATALQVIDPSER